MNFNWLLDNLDTHEESGIKLNVHKSPRGNIHDSAISSEFKNSLLNSHNVYLSRPITSFSIYLD